MLGQNWNVFANIFSNGDATLVGVERTGEVDSGSFEPGVSHVGGEFFEAFCEIILFNQLILKDNVALQNTNLRH